jgi:phosphatidyl-myo-inositol dimannoside synthase
MHRIVRHASRLQVRVVTRRSPGAFEFDRREGLDVKRAGRAGGGASSNLLLNGRALMEALRFRPRAVLSGHIVMSPAARAIGKAAGAPVIQYLHADELRTRPRTASFAVGADAVLAVSAHTEQLALAAGADPQRVRRIPNGVDLPQERRTERAGRPTIVTVARLEQRYKGHDVLIRALPLVRQRVPDVEWLVVGDGSLRQELERLADAQQLGETARFLGVLPEEERDAALDRAHVFAMPSRLPPGRVGGEGFGIVYLEAAAHGLPSVAGNVGGAPDAVVHGETGLLVDPEDHVAVANALVELLLEPARAAALGAAGATRAREFAWPLIARRVEELVFDLARPEST